VVAGAALIQTVDPASGGTAADPSGTRTERFGGRAAATEQLGVPGPASVPGGAFGTDPSTLRPSGAGPYGVTPGPQTFTRGS
jgi:hypothetical protein